MVEHVGTEGIVVHHGGADGREAKVLLKGPGRVDDGVLVHVERVDGEGRLGLRGREGGRVHGVVVERVLVQVGLCLGVGGDHDAVDGRDLGRGFCSPLGGLIRALARERGEQGTEIRKLTRRSSMLVLRT